MEAALVVPLVLGAVFFVILYTFWLHDRTLAEILVRDSVEQTRLVSGEEATQFLWEETGRLLWIPVEAAEVRQNTEQVQGTLAGGSVTVGMGFAPSFETKAKLRRLDPPTLLRLCCLLLE